MEFQLPPLAQPKKRPRRASALKPITVTIEDTCHLMRLGQSSVFELLAEGALRSTKVAGRRLVFYASIEELLKREALPADSLGSTSLPRASASTDRNDGGVEG